MLQHGGSSSKPTIFWGNLSTMGDLNRGRLTQEERVAKTTVSTTRSLVANKIVNMHVSKSVVPISTIQILYSHLRALPRP